MAPVAINDRGEIVGSDTAWVLPDAPFSGGTAS
jgi:hypothetical protein